MSCMVFWKRGGPSVGRPLKYCRGCHVRPIVGNGVSATRDHFLRLLFRFFLSGGTEHAPTTQHSSENKHTGHTAYAHDRLTTEYYNDDVISWLMNITPQLLHTRTQTLRSINTSTAIFFFTVLLLLLRKYVNYLLLFIVTGRRRVPPLVGEEKPKHCYRRELSRYHWPRSN